MKNKYGQVEAVVGLSFIVIFAIIFCICIAGFDSVPAGYIGVKDRLGVVNEQPWGPGIQWTGILTHTEEFSTRIQLNEYDASAASKDLQDVKTKVALNFRLNPAFAPKIYKELGLNYADIIITPVVQEAVKANTAKYDAEELITKRGEVKNAITELITQKLENKGLVVTEVSITDFVFSQEFINAVERKQAAAQDALTAENKLREMQSTAAAMKLQAEVVEIKKLDIELKKLDVLDNWINKWDGVMPQYMLADSSNILLGLNTK